MPSFSPGNPRSMATESEVRLNGGCTVLTLDTEAQGESQRFTSQCLVGPGTGARHLSQFRLRLESGLSPVLGGGPQDLVLFVLRGSADVLIGNRKFGADAWSGLHVRPGETMTLVTNGPQPLDCLVTCCPGLDRLPMASQASDRFDDAFPERQVSATDSRRETTGDRWFKLLVNPAIGSEQVTQFIGMIPPSRAPEHFHDYEEAICVLSGHGRLWSGDEQTPIAPGCVIFLPERQPHCLECLDGDGMELVGIFYPAGSPANNTPTHRETPA